MNLKEINKKSNAYTKKSIEALKSHVWTVNTEAKGKEDIKNYINLVFFIAFIELDKILDCDNKAKIEESYLTALSKEFKDLELILKYSDSQLKYKGHFLGDKIKKDLENLNWKGDYSKFRILNQNLIFMDKYSPFNLYFDKSIKLIF